MRMVLVLCILSSLKICVGVKIQTVMYTSDTPTLLTGVTLINFFEHRFTTSRGDSLLSEYFSNEF